MSAISGYINTIQNAVYGEQVRTAIVNALQACYSDVENPDLQSAAFQEAIEAAYQSGILDITEVTLVSQMTNENIIYRYMGTETGYDANTLYYYNGTAWVPIGSDSKLVNAVIAATATTGNPAPLYSDWKRKTINAAGGRITYADSTTRLATNPIPLWTNKEISVSIASGYKYKIFALLADGSTLKQEIDFTTESTTYTFNDDVEAVAFLLSNTANGTIYPFESQYITITGAFPNMTATTAQKNAVDAIDRVDGLTVPADILKDTTVTRNTIYNDGAIQASTTRLLTDFINATTNPIIKVTQESGYRHELHIYDSTQTRIDHFGWRALDTEYNLKEINPNTAYIRILLADTSDGTIALDDTNNFEVISNVFRAESAYVPEYFESQISTAVNAVRNKLFEFGHNGDAFVFFSDSHWEYNEKHSPAIVKEVLDGVNIQKIISGGDAVYGGRVEDTENQLQLFTDQYKELGRFYAIIGNHDMNKYGNTAWSKYVTYSIMQKHMDFIADYETEGYFYFDNKSTKTRFICLDSETPNTAYTTAQIAWLNTLLTSAPADYKIIVFSHIIYTADSWSVGMPTSDLYLAAFAQSVITALDTHNAAETGAEVVAFFGGHCHQDYNTTTPGGIPIILIDCDAMQTYSTDSGGNRNQTKGTVTEQCIDVVTIDYLARKINCYRIGRGIDREITF